MFLALIFLSTSILLVLNSFWVLTFFWAITFQTFSRNCRCTNFTLQENSFVLLGRLCLSSTHYFKLKTTPSLSDVLALMHVKSTVTRCHISRDLNSSFFCSSLSLSKLPLSIPLFSLLSSKQQIEECQVLMMVMRGKRNANNQIFWTFHMSCQFLGVPHLEKKFPPLFYVKNIFFCEVIYLIFFFIIIGCHSSTIFLTA